MLSVVHWLLDTTGTPGFSGFKEKFTVIDHEKMLKNTEVVEGGYLDVGFTLYLVRFEVIKNGDNSCITRTTIEYEAKEDAADAVSMVSLEPLMIIMKAVGEYLTSQQK
ncbi:hypothetical protein Leryth_000250 [Lithospermum erythrorhizon]|nr:hypothetical protein Leryth_000250 [Lithospermum erythrorhizon]